jgi:GR25 family glycosyltransferase involved in LPS biosynthesis
VTAKTSIESYLIDIDIQHQDSGINLVDCVYVINLEYRPQKWIETNNSFNLYGIHPNRVNAVNGWGLCEEDKQILSGHYPVRMNGGRIGCILSHVSAIRDAYRRGYENIWVCEDDIQICQNPHLINNYILMLSRIDPQWDILYTDSNSKNHLGEIVPSVASDFRPDLPHENLAYYLLRAPITRDMIRINQRFGAYSMIISKRGVEKILRHFTENYLWTPYDIDIHYTPKIKQYCIKRDLVSFDYKKPSDTEAKNE